MSALRAMYSSRHVGTQVTEGQGSSEQTIRLLEEKG